MTVKPFAAIAVGLVLSGCSPSDIWASLQGYQKVKCDESPYVSARVQNQTAGTVNFSLCSPDEASPMANFSIGSNSGVQRFTTKTKNVIVEEWISRTDECATKSLTPYMVGEQIPILSAADQLTTQICLDPANPAYPQYPSYKYKVYLFASKIQPCPAGSAVFDPATVTCKLP